MSYDRNIKYLNDKRIIYRTTPTDKPTKVYNWGLYYKNGTYQCYDLFRSKAKINTYKSLKWHLLVLWYLNPELNPDQFKQLAYVLTTKENGFTTFSISDNTLEKILHDVYMSDLEEPPTNRLRKIIFNTMCGLTSQEKLKIVGELSGKTKKVQQDDLYQSMLDINDMGVIITIKNLAELFKCSSRTIHRNMGEELKREKELLNKEIEKI